MHGFSRRQILEAAASLSLLSCKTSVPEPPARRESSEAREVVRVIAAAPSIDGAGVHLSRSIGSRDLSILDPFLLLDEIRSNDPKEYEAGFPRHPHRGFETVTYMVEGAMVHKDSMGNTGRLLSGSLQWMTAGRGIVHSEMPQREGTNFWGFQLWVNLPKRLKMTSPRYQDIAPDRVPEIGHGAKTRVLAGARGGATGPVDGVYVAPAMLDVTLSPGDTFTHELPKDHAAFVYVLSGAAQIGAKKTAVGAQHLAVLGKGPVVTARAGTEASRFLLVAAAPIGEPVARRGPFVMNTEEELDRAFEDYRNGTLTSG